MAHRPAWVVRLRRPGGRYGVLWLAAVVAVSVVAAAPHPRATYSARSSAVVADTLTVIDGAGAAGIAELNKSWSAKPVDYDSDGDEDLWIGYHQWSGKLWRNNGDGTYTRVAPTAWPRQNSEGRQPDRHDCAWADVDLDGRPDAYCSAGRNLSNLVKNGMDNELWLQLAPGQFTDVGTEWGVGDVCGRGRHVVFLNANGDAYPDLFLGNETPRNVSSDPCNVASNRLPSEESKLFLNTGGTGFQQAPASFGISGYAAGQRCAEVFDFNDDGSDDFIACRMKNQTPRLYRNDGGTGFTDVATTAGLTSAAADAAVSDLDGDGDPDLVFATKSDFSYRLNTNGRFGASVRIGTVGSSGEGRSVAVGDVDGDGHLDVYGLVMHPSNGTNPNDVLFLNNGNQTFTPMTVPSAGGDGDEVIAVHPLVNGPAAFLVLNGGESDSSGPVQLIETRVEHPGPTAKIKEPVSCQELTCSFDASASTADGTPTYDWDFGDDTTGVGATTDHTYADAGVYPVRLMVTGSDGATATATTSVEVGPGVEPGALAFRGATSATAWAKTLHIQVPATTAAGDGLLLFVSGNQSAPVISTPTGWSKIGTRIDQTMQTQLWWRAADAASAGSDVRLLASGRLRLDAQVLAYSSPAASNPVTVVSAAETATRATHRTPEVTAAGGELVVSYWADRGTTSTWSVPAGVSRRVLSAAGTETGRVTSVSADSGSPVAAGPAGGLTATAGSASGQATMWTVLIRPGG